MLSVIGLSYESLYLLSVILLTLLDLVESVMHG